MYYDQQEVLPHERKHHHSCTAESFGMSLFYFYIFLTKYNRAGGFFGRNTESQSHFNTATKHAARKHQKATVQLMSITVYLNHELSRSRSDVFNNVRAVLFRK